MDHPTPTSDESPAELYAWWGDWGGRLDAHLAIGSAGWSRAGWGDRKAQLQAECNSTARWTKLLDQLPQSDERARGNLLIWLRSTGVVLPTDPRVGTPELMRRGVERLQEVCALAPTESAQQFPTQVLARWIQAFAAHGPAASSAGAPPEERSPRTSPLTWRDLASTERTALLEDLLALHSSVVKDALLESFPMEDLGLDTHWASVVKDLMPRPPRSLSLSPPVTEPRLARWQPPTYAHAATLDTLLNRPDWPATAIDVLVDGPQAVQRLALVAGVVETPTAALQRLVAGAPIRAREDVHTVLRLARGPAGNPTLDTALVAPVGQLINHWIREAPADQPSEEVFDLPFVNWYLGQAAVVAQLDPAVRRRILLSGPADAKVRLVGGMAQDLAEPHRGLEPAEPPPAVSARPTRPSLQR